MIPPMPHDLPEPRLKPNTEVVLQKRYLHKKADGSTETPRDLFWRVSSAIAAEEAKYERSPFTVDDLARRFYDLMTSWRFLPNSPTLMNAASELGQLSACFVLPVGDSIEEIFDAVKFAAMIHKSGGGTGFSFSRLRPKASRVGSTGGVASGPMTATFLLPLAQGACLAVGGNIVTDAFGVVAMVAMTPLITIQILGMTYQLKQRHASRTQQAYVDAFACLPEDAIIEL